MSRTVVDDPVLGDDKSVEAREIRCSLTVSRGSGLVLGFDLETKRLGEVVWKSGIRSRLIRMPRFRSRPVLRRRFSSRCRSESRGFGPGRGGAASCIVVTGASDQLEYPDGGRRCKLRFDVSGFDDDEVAVTTDSTSASYVPLVPTSTDPAMMSALLRATDDGCPTCPVRVKG